MLLGMSPSPYFLNDLLLINLGLLPYLFHLRFSMAHVDILMVSASCVGVFDILRRGFEGISFDYLRSYATTESNIGLVIGAFAAAYAVSGRIAQSVFSIFLCVVFFKRISILASICTIMLGLILGKARAASRFRTRRLIILVIFAVFLVMSVVQDWVFNVIASLFSGVSIEGLSMGRYRWIQVLKEEIFGFHAQEAFWGRGAGSSSKLLHEMFGIVHAHASYLRMVYDFGLIGTAVFIWVWANSLARSVYGTMVAFYLACVLFTDNVLVYVGYNWIFAAIAMSVPSAIRMAGKRDASLEERDGARSVRVVGGVNPRVPVVRGW